MPTYAYRCKNCDYAFDIHQAFTDDALRVCPECGEEKLRKVFGTVGVTFKGSGFYATDSRSASSASAPASSGSSSGAGSADSGSASSGASGTGSGASSAGSEGSSSSSSKPAAAAS
ncbi:MULTISPECIES: FmdB family zinc ribbon protein [Brevibacterium]|jgi:putative FmdB family regulatory protein|uniref:Putative regulatory protein FmdB zinc ribbon domain-containing protein n=1 Tax=Brevibacterium salitolerans TaxID=1403566 RepID=A0ABN2WHZ4_9MICO|nr:FmdB family zinc ribbon protein [Brevibacterium sp.]